jgi:hypothetical protein
MIEDSTDYYQVEEKFLVVLDSAIPSEVGNIDEYNTPFLQTRINNSLTNKSDLKFDLQYPIQKSSEDIQLKCSVKSAVFPNSQYVINSTNSYFAVGLLDSTYTPIINANLVVEIPVGNYSTESLRQTLQSAMQNEFDDNGYDEVIWTVGYDTIKSEYVFSFTTTSVDISEFFISFQPADIATYTAVSQLGTVIGFLNDYRYYSNYKIEALSTNAVFSYVSKKITANYPSNVSGLRSFNVVLKNYHTSSIPIRPYNSQFGFKNSILNSSFNNSDYQQFYRQNIICNVSCNANPMDYIFYEKSSDFYIDLKEPFLSRFHILLTDNYGNLLELNNQDWTIVLEISLLKKKEFKTKSFYEYLSNP